MKNTAMYILVLNSSFIFNNYTSQNDVHYFISFVNINIKT